MHNLNTVIKFEVIRTLKKPSFWISVLSIPVLIGVIIGITFFSQNATENTINDTNKQPFSVYIQDDSGLLSAESIQSVSGKVITDKELGVSSVKNGQVDAFFYYPNDLVGGIVEVYNKNDGLTGNDKFTFIAKNLLNISVSQKINSTEMINIIKGDINVIQKNYSNGAEVNVISSIIVPGIFLVIFYTVIVLLGNQMLASTTEEKENRVTEMLLTSLSSKTLIVGKIIALVILGLIQILTTLIPILAAYIFARDSLNIPDLSSFVNSIQFEFWPVFIGAGMLIFGFLLFTGLLVGIGAAAPTAKDANSFFGFVILMMFVPFYFMSMLISGSSSNIITALTFFPLTAPVTVMARNAFGTISLTDSLIGLVIVAIFGILAIQIAIQIFRYGTLEYSKRLSIRTIFASSKNTKK